VKLSIIIPAYNVGDYIADCLSSLTCQKLQKEDFEIIFIDDGSTDNTVEIARNHLKGFENVRFFNNESNLGNGGARNIGIDAAKGSYIYFIDADDYLAKDCLRFLLDSCSENNLEMFFFSMKIVKDGNHLLSKNDWENIPAIEISDGISFIGKRPYRDEVWSYLVNRKFLEDSNVRYYDNSKFAQDLYITSKLLSLAKIVGYIDYDVYRYRKTPNSIVTKKTEEHLIAHMESVRTAIIKCHGLRQELIHEGVENQNALLRLIVKQQRFLTIIIMRFVQSSQPFSYLEKMLNEFKSLGIYPMYSLYKLNDFIIPKHKFINFIFNRPLLLRPLTKIYRLYKR